LHYFYSSLKFIADVVAQMPPTTEVAFLREVVMVQAIAAQHPTPARKPRLRELGIYTLPDGREFVVSTIYRDGCSLYTQHAWVTLGTAEYWIDGDGRLLHQGVPSIWGVQDLKDTGKSASYPKPMLR
jgi:hypothetical protein